MDKSIQEFKEYKNWLIEIKSKIRSVQNKAAVALTSALIEFYWELGEMINEKQSEYGSQFLNKLSKDLQEEFLTMNGFSVRNLKYCRQFYQFYNVLPKGQQPVALLEERPIFRIPGDTISSSLPNQKT